MPTEEMRFGFGKNWEKFIRKYYSEERLQVAQKHLLDFLELVDLKGKSFLDIGCGSGLHSLAAYRSGAERIFSFDYDQDSVNTTVMLRKMAGSPDNWVVKQGSVLDREFMSSIEPADVVYSWGVLHHTGDMWTALENVGGLVKNNALLYIALYDYDVQIDPTPEDWLEVKQRYNREGWLARRKLEWWYIWRFCLGYRLRAIPGFIKRVWGHGQSRGMAFYTDIKDWLGGWPMEFAKVDEVNQFYRDKFGLNSRKVKTGEACAEFLYQKNK